MAHARLVSLALALAAAGSASAAGPCEEDRGQTGLALAVAASGGLAVAAVDDDSAAAAGGFRVGDAVVQANGTLAGSCGEYARVVREARRERKAVLLLVRRADADVPLALGAGDRKSTRLNSSHRCISYAVFCLKKKKKKTS